MGTLTGVLTFPGLRPNGSASLQAKVASNTRVDYQSTPEGALVRRAQEGDEAAFREILEHYQAKVFSIIHGIVRHLVLRESNRGRRCSQRDDDGGSEKQNTRGAFHSPYPSRLV